MTVASVAGFAGTDGHGRAFVRARASVLLDWLVALWIFSGALVLFEPSPYEVGFLLVLATALFGGLSLHRATLPLFAIFVLFIPFALIGAFQVRHTDLGDALLFNMVTAFLVLTSYVAANYVANAPERRMRIIGGAYLLAALVSALLGTLGYLQLIPGSELFTRYDRAKALFNDPNVFGPFLILPAMFALQRLLLGRGPALVWPALALAVLFFGVFASFSRAAWGHMAVSAIAVVALSFWLEAGGRQKLRIVVLSILALLALLVAIGGLLSIPAVQELYEVRTQAQAYDTGENGRFGRQGFAFDIALANPWGIGPLEFRHLRVVEEPHNTYANVLHLYGWGGGLCLYALIVLTIWRGVRGLAQAGPHRAMLIPLVAVFVPLAAEAAIIDVDHWRHFFLIAGLIWGTTAGIHPTRFARIRSIVPRANVAA